MNAAIAAVLRVETIDKKNILAQRIDNLCVHAIEDVLTRNDIGAECEITLSRLRLKTLLRDAFTEGVKISVSEWLTQIVETADELKQTQRKVDDKSLGEP
jgi:DNA-binding transcriptional regulator LsrR (DeoR family)